jgi:hypothetical protein
VTQETELDSCLVFAQDFEAVSDFRLVELNIDRKLLMTPDSRCDCCSTVGSVIDDAEREDVEEIGDYYIEKAMQLKLVLKLKKVNVIKWN